MLSATELHELFRINLLIAHFNETKANDKSISFTDFLVEHYITDDGNKKDDERDRQLPFKSHNLVAGTPSIFTLEQPETFVPASCRIVKKDFNNYRNPLFKSNFRDIVWNPPKVSLDI